MDNKNNSMPLSVIRKNLKVKWYRCPIDKRTLKELSSPSDFKGFIYALGHLGLWFGTGQNCSVVEVARIEPATPNSMQIHEIINFY